MPPWRTGAGARSTSRGASDGVSDGASAGGSGVKRSTCDGAHTSTCLLLMSVFACIYLHGEGTAALGADGVAAFVHMALLRQFSSDMKHAVLMKGRRPLDPCREGHWRLFFISSAMPQEELTANEASSTQPAPSLAILANSALSPLPADSQSGYNARFALFSGTLFRCTLPLNGVDGVASVGPHGVCAALPPAVEEALTEARLCRGFVECLMFRRPDALTTHWTVRPKDRQVRTTKGPSHRYLWPPGGLLTLCCSVPWSACSAFTSSTLPPMVCLHAVARPPTAS